MIIHLVFHVNSANCPDAHILFTFFVNIFQTCFSYKQHLLQMLQFLWVLHLDKFSRLLAGIIQVKTNVFVSSCWRLILSRWTYFLHPSCNEATSILYFRYNINFLPPIMYENYLDKLCFSSANLAEHKRYLREQYNARMEKKIREILFGKKVLRLTRLHQKITLIRKSSTEVLPFQSGSTIFCLLDLCICPLQILMRVMIHT